MSTTRSFAASAMPFLLGIVLLSPDTASAHCDGLDGPVVTAAQEALASGEVDRVLIWVRKDDEPEIREAFDRTLAVRKLGGEAKALADLYFFETLVRIHRAGEGAPYTGIQPAGRDLGPAIPLADRALATGEVEPLVKLITDETRQGVVERFDHAARSKSFASGDVEAGRRHVESYVTFIHYVERAYEAASRPVEGHFPDAAHAAPEHAE